MADRPPNIVFIMACDLGADDLGYTDVGPGIDRIAEWREWTASMLPEIPGGFSEAFTAAQLADHIGARKS